MTGPEIATERLELWRPQARDLPGLVDLLADDEVRRFLGARPTGEVEEFNRLMRNAGGWALYGHGIFTVRPKGADEIIGIAGVFHSWRGIPGLDDVPEAGWIFARKTWGQGIAGEAMRAAIAWYRGSHGNGRIACMINEPNLASIALAEKLGFRRYGTHPQGDDMLILLELG
ncbi:GNAT family N-acetyltransferase [Novosphingobium cyanobacteriorum]|uniref:GNAT family N-acetyltransferase n=1 Tax=Novosphingobium cyanobacteriorum TaxID=3024215 RepID=A0ABT6CG53_9SPHN|nr:GNAT family N-acetyltransferase [Novosphingobium cyanobacteriorum]MDF8332905.1 GNAT family N-acetyltransferase [Novosphingobium cyanobacteriorum]